MTELTFGQYHPRDFVDASLRIEIAAEPAQHRGHRALGERPSRPALDEDDAVVIELELDR